MKLKMSGVLAALIILAGATVALAQGSTTMQKTAPAAAAGPFDKALLTPSALNAKAPETFDVKFTTSAGDFTVHITRAWAPLGADRFYNMVKHHFFDGAAFFRVIRSPRPFMVQFGLNPYPEVNKAWTNAAIHDDPVKQSNKRGMITYAAQNAPNTRTTQVFINYADNGFLDASRFAPFGEVTSGMDVVDKLYSGYGEGAPSGSGPDQDKVTNQGKAYLEKNFPKLDTIKTTTLTVPPPAAATPKP
jgi:peptidyl-prolyl cis-trans isomerase A (cyclophilin A)